MKLLFCRIFGRSIFPRSIKRVFIILVAVIMAIPCYAGNEEDNQQDNEQVVVNNDSDDSQFKNNSNDDESFSVHLKKVKFPEKYKLKELVVGKDTAEISLTIYFSYTCPHCREFHIEEYPKFKKTYVDTGKVKIIFRNYIDDQGSLEAAQIIRCLCGEFVDEYMALSRAVLSQQIAWLDSKDPANFLKNIFEGQGIKKEEIENCLKKTSIGAGLMIEQQRAMHELNIPSVPAFIVNGKMHIGRITSEELAKMCDLL